MTKIKEVWGKVVTWVKETKNLLRDAWVVADNLRMIRATAKNGHKVVINIDKKLMEDTRKKSREDMVKTMAMLTASMQFIEKVFTDEVHEILAYNFPDEKRKPLTMTVKDIRHKKGKK